MQPPIDPSTLRFGPWRPRLATRAGLGVVIEGLEHAEGVVAPADYVDEVLLTAEHRALFLALIDAVGLVVCKNVGGDDATHRDVRGRSSRGRLSQGEYYHHDGCSGPNKPRVVEIRCPHQPVARRVATAVAPFPEVLYAQLVELPGAIGERLGAIEQAQQRLARQAFQRLQQHQRTRSHQSCNPVPD